MFGWSKRKREAAAAAAATKQAEWKRSWLTYFTEAGFTDQQAECLFHLLTVASSTSSTNSQYAMMAAAMAMSSFGAARAQ
jgi:hypothetical protein